MRRWRSSLLGVCVALLVASAASAQEKTSDLALHLGTFGIWDGLPTSIEAGFELRSSVQKVPVLHHMVTVRFIGGAAATHDGGYFLYGGVRRERALPHSWSLGLSFAVAVYEDGRTRDLNGRIEFRSAIDLSYQLPRKVRLGLTLHHLSHAGFYGMNPGSESLLLTFAAPLLEGGA